MVSPLTPLTQGLQSPSVGQELLGAISQGKQIRSQTLQNQARQQDVSEMDFQTGLRKLQIINKLATNVRQLPMEQRQAYIQRFDKNMLNSVGISSQDLASAPLDDAGLDQLISQTGSVIQGAMPQQTNMNRVQSSQILDDGTVVTVMSDGTVQVKDAQGKVLSGQAATDAIRVAQEYSTNLQGQRAGSRTGATLDVRTEKEPTLKADVKQAEQDVMLATEPELQRKIQDAKTFAKLEAEKRMAQSGQSNKLEDADRIYKSLGNSDLDVIYGRGEQYYPEILRSQKGIDMIAQRDQLVGMLNLAARGELKGQGSITDQEAATVIKAATTLANPNISPDLAREALDAAMDIIYRNAGKQFGGSGQGANTTGINGNTFTSKSGIQFQVE